MLNNSTKHPRVFRARLTTVRFPLRQLAVRWEIGWMVFLQSCVVRSGTLIVLYAVLSSVIVVNLPRVTLSQPM